MPGLTRHPEPYHTENTGCRVKPGMTIAPIGMVLIIATQPGKPESRETYVIKQPAVYILASKRNGTLYIGVTSNLIKRIWEHKNNSVKGFTEKYNIHRLVWFELHDNIESAIIREKRLKNWNRKWKLELIESVNPEWHDLYDTIV